MLAASRQISCIPRKFVRRTKCLWRCLPCRKSTPAVITLLCTGRLRTFLRGAVSHSNKDRIEYPLDHCQLLHLFTRIEFLFLNCRFWLGSAFVNAQSINHNTQISQRLHAVPLLTMSRMAKRLARPCSLTVNTANRQAMLAANSQYVASRPASIGQLQLPPSKSYLIGMSLFPV